MADDRPKKSWRELDRAKDKSRVTGEPRNFDDRKSYMDGKSRATEKYKSNLDALFGGGAALPEALRAKLGMEPESEESKARKKAIEAISKTPTQKAIAAFVTEGHEWPNDPRILMGCLGITDEKLIQPVLAALIVHFAAVRTRCSYKGAGEDAGLGVATLDLEASDGVLPVAEAPRARSPTLRRGTYRFSVLADAFLCRLHAVFALVPVRRADLAVLWWSASTLRMARRCRPRGEIGTTWCRTMPSLSMRKSGRDGVVHEDAVVREITS